MYIDVSFDFTTDSPGYWDHFWENYNGLGRGNCDPDAVSQTLRAYHQILWSKELPCGRYMELEHPKDDYLRWGDMYFGSDSITNSFRYGYYPLIGDVMSTPGYKQRMEDFIHRTYTIGGTIIFPVHRYSFNQARGMNAKIRDRWDWSLECIRRFYIGEDSPLAKQMKSDTEFYKLFVNFQGFVEFFYLQDCVTDDWKVRTWTEGIPFERPAFPQSVEEYWRFIEHEIIFVEKRNKRIRELME